MTTYYLSAEEAADRAAAGKHEPAGYEVLASEDDVQCVICVCGAIGRGPGEPGSEVLPECMVVHRFGGGQPPQLRIDLSLVDVRNPVARREILSWVQTARGRYGGHGTIRGLLREEDFIFPDGSKLSAGLRDQD